jgi:hypothetical protein
MPLFFTAEVTSPVMSMNARGALVLTLRADLNVAIALSL